MARKYVDEWPNYRGAVSLTMDRAEWQHFAEAHQKAARLVNDMKAKGSLGKDSMDEMVHVRNVVYGMLTRIATSEQLVGPPQADPLRTRQRMIDVG